VGVTPNPVMLTLLLLALPLLALPRPVCAGDPRSAADAQRSSAAPRQSGWDTNGRDANPKAWEGSVVGLAYSLALVPGTEGYCRNSTECWAAIRAANQDPRVDWVAIQIPKT